MNFGFPNSGFFSNSDVLVILFLDLLITAYLPEPELTGIIRTNLVKSTLRTFCNCGFSTSTGTTAPPSTTFNPSRVCPLVRMNVFNASLTSNVLLLLFIFLFSFAGSFSSNSFNSVSKSEISFSKFSFSSFLADNSA